MGGLSEIWPSARNGFSVAKRRAAVDELGALGSGRVGNHPGGWAEYCINHESSGKAQFQASRTAAEIGGGISERPSFEPGCCPALGPTKLVLLARIEFFSRISKSALDPPAVRPLGCWVAQTGLWTSEV